MQHGHPNMGYHTEFKHHGGEMVRVPFFFWVKHLVTSFCFDSGRSVMIIHSSVNRYEKVKNHHT